MLHQPPEELRKAEAMSSQRRVRGYNLHTKQEKDGGWGKFLEHEAKIRRANRRAHRVPVSS